MTARTWVRRLLRRPTWECARCGFRVYRRLPTVPGIPQAPVCSGCIGEWIDSGYADIYSQRDDPTEPQGTLSDR